MSNKSPEFVRKGYRKIRNSFRSEEAETCIIYIPKLSEKDCMLFRLGGAGLGNILFTYARAVIYVQKHEKRK